MPNQLLKTNRTEWVPRRVVDIFFRQIPVEVVLASIPTLPQIPSIFRNTLASPSRKLIVLHLLHQSRGLSGDDCEQMVKMALQTGSGNNMTLKWIQTFATSCLTLDKNGGLEVEFDEYLRWRNLSYLLTEDLFTAAFWACQDIRPSSFFWPQVLLSNNKQLSDIVFENELADNHVHLNAAGPVFIPTWIILMNKPALIPQALDLSGLDSERFIPFTNFTSGLEVINLRNQLIFAAGIRQFLVESIHRNLDGEDLPPPPQELITFPQNAHMNLDKVIFKINISRGMAELKYQGLSDVVDYSWTLCGEELDLSFRSNIDDITILSCGERAFLYYMFKELLDKSESKLQEYADYFYCYLLIKHSLRGEFVMVNDQVGFHNFVRYESRKDVVANLDDVVGAIRTGTYIRTALRNGDPHKIDLRFNPGGKRTSAEALNQYLVDREYEILHKKVRIDHGREVDPNLLGNESESLKKQFQFIGHFIKRAYEPDALDAELFTYPRHHALRNEVQAIAINIFNLRTNGFTMGSRLQGIDAAASEIQCRPEIFAQAFRFLRQNVQPASPLSQLFDSSSLLVDLKFKFHCGEDFTNPIDGMRYIDEAVQFLDLRSRDHLGHSLAMGIDLNQWYQAKSFRYQTTRQDYIDNICWLICRSIDLNVDLESGLVQNLNDEFQREFEHVYSSAIPHSNSVTPETYYKAWKLRGDAPELYQEGIQRQEVPVPSSFWENYSVNKVPFCNEKVDRDDPVIASIYRAYHFNPKVKRIGFETINIKSHTTLPIKLKPFQQAFRNFIFDQGFHIETLPSINVHLGSFRRFDMHPIFEFLPPTPDYFPRLERAVSVSTDNPGLVNTTMKAEFTSLACAISKARKEGRNMGFQTEMDYYNWLRQLAQNGWKFF